MRNHSQQNAPHQVHAYSVNTYNQQPHHQGNNWQQRPPSLHYPAGTANTNDSYTSPQLPPQSVPQHYKNAPNNNNQVPTISYNIAVPSQQLHHPVQHQQQLQQKTTSSLHRQQQGTPNFAPVTSRSSYRQNHKQSRQQQRCQRTNSSQASSYSNHRRQPLNINKNNPKTTSVMMHQKLNNNHQAPQQQIIFMPQQNNQHQQQHFSKGRQQQMVMNGAPPRPETFTRDNSQQFKFKNCSQNNVPPTEQQQQVAVAPPNIKINFNQNILSQQLHLQPTNAGEDLSQGITSGQQSAAEDQENHDPNRGGGNQQFNMPIQNSNTNLLQQSNSAQQIHLQQIQQKLNQPKPSQQQKFQMKSQPNSAMNILQHKNKAQAVTQIQSLPSTQQHQYPPKSQVILRCGQKQQNPIVVKPQTANIVQQKQRAVDLAKKNKDQQLKHYATANANKGETRQSERVYMNKMTTAATSTSAVKQTKSGVNTTQQSTQRQNSNPQNLHNTSNTSHQNRPKSTSIGCNESKNKIKIHVDAGSKGFLEDTISSSFFLIQNQQTQKKQQAQQNQYKTRSVDRIQQKMTQQMKQRQQVPNNNASAVLPNVLSESAEELFWKYTNVKQQNNNTKSREKYNSYQQKKTSKQEQILIQNFNEQQSLLTTNQENLSTLKDSLGQSNSNQIADFFQNGTKQQQMTFETGSIPQSQVTTFENYRKVQNTTSMAPGGPIIVSVQKENREMAKPKRRPQSSMDITSQQRSFGSMQTLGRINGSEHAFHTANVSMNVDQSVLPIASTKIIERKQVTQQPSPRSQGNFVAPTNRHRRSRSYISTDELSQLSQLHLHKRNPSGQYGGSNTSATFVQPSATNNILLNSHNVSQSKLNYVPGQSFVSQDQSVQIKNQKPPLNISVAATAATNTQLQTPISKQAAPQSQSTYRHQYDYPKSIKNHQNNVDSQNVYQPVTVLKQEPNKFQQIQSTINSSTNTLQYQKKQKVKSIKGELKKVINQVQIKKQTEFEEAAKVRQQLFQEIMNGSNPIDKNENNSDSSQEDENNFDNQLNQQQQVYQQQHDGGIVQQQTEVVYQNVARRRYEYQPTQLNAISEKEDFKTIANSDYMTTSAQKDEQQLPTSVQHTLTPTQCPDSDLKKAIEEQQIFPESEVIINGRNLLDQCQQQDKSYQIRDSIASISAHQLNMLTQKQNQNNPEIHHQHQYEQPNQQMTYTGELNSRNIPNQQPMTLYPVKQQSQQHHPSQQNSSYHHQQKFQTIPVQKQAYSTTLNPQQVHQQNNQPQQVEDDTSYLMNNLTMSNLTNVNPLLFTQPEGSSSNNQGRRMGSMQDYGGESPSNILLSHQSSSAPYHSLQNQASKKHLKSIQHTTSGGGICAPQLLQSSEVVRHQGPKMQSNCNQNPNQQSSSVLSQQYNHSSQHQVALTEPSLPSGLLQQKTLDMDQLLRSFLREQHEGVMSISGGGTNSHQSEQAIPISSIIDAYHNSTEYTMPVPQQPQIYHQQQQFEENV